MSAYLGVAGVQMEVVRGEDNTDRMLKKLKVVAACFPWVDIVLFPEFCLCGMNPSLAKPVPNPDMEPLLEWAATEKKWLVPGSMFEQDGDRTFNTSVVISPEGRIVEKYRKMFPWRPLEENDPGESFCLFDIPGKGRLGLCICYDQWFPEVIRNLTWMGAEVILHIAATDTSDRAQELVLSQAHAVMNQVYFLSVNGVGGGGIGSSIFVDPEGRVLQQAGQRDTILTEVIDFDAVRRVREYGTIGLSQLWKDFRDSKAVFPIYDDEKREGAVYRKLGELKRHEKIE